MRTWKIRMVIVLSLAFYVGSIGLVLPVANLTTGNGITIAHTEFTPNPNVISTPIGLVHPSAGCWQTRCYY